MRWRRAGVAGAALMAVLGSGVAQAAAPELSTSDRLKDRRYVASSERAYVEGFEDGRFYANGWHITGEMGGIWTAPLKLADGVWFGIDDEWVGPATKFTSGWGYTSFALPETAGLKVSRTDFAPDGGRAVLFGLKLTNPGAETRTVTVKVDAHSELMSAYPWGSEGVMPRPDEVSLQDTAAFNGKALVFRDAGQGPPGTESHNWAALVGSTREPVAGETGPGHRGPQGSTVCTGERPPAECDDGPFGKGAGGQLRYEVTVPANGSADVWVAVAGSGDGVEAAQSELADALEDPAGALREKRGAREGYGAFTRLSLPGDPLLAEGVDWGKQNLLDLTQAAEGLKIRAVDQGKRYPEPSGTVYRVRFIGAGFPDYPWLFATDGEYTAFANVAVGQFESIEDHMRALRDVSDILNARSGKVGHEIVTDGSVWFGTNEDPGNTDETAKFPSTVALIWRWTGDNAFRDEMYSFAKRNLRYIYRELDQDGDGWPEGLGNVERKGMGPEKLDNAVYTIRGLYDLADMARSKGDVSTWSWARGKARSLRQRFEADWWMPEVPQHADSLLEPGNEKLQQRHWIGVTPMEAELTVNGRTVPGLTTLDHGTKGLALRETTCYSGSPPSNPGLFHTGSPGCDGATGDGKGEKTIFSLNNAIQAVGEGNYGRLGAGQQQRYTTANRQTMLPEPDEQPGAMPEILPSPDFRRNIDRCWTCRSMLMQAWGNYGTAWPVVHQQLGVRPDMGRRRLEVVPQLPATQPIAGENIRVGDGAVDVSASRSARTYTTTVDTADSDVTHLWIGHTLARTARVKSVRLDGDVAKYRTVSTNRGLEVTVGTNAGSHRLTVTTY